MFAQVSIWLVYIGTMVLFLLTAEMGFRLGKRLRLSGEDEGEGTTLGGLLALLGLLLGFTFAMAGNRYDNRRQLLLDEANAIGTAYLRADLLPDPLKSEIRNLFRAYVDLRIEAARTGKVDESVTASERIQGEIWSRTAAQAVRDPTVPTGLFVEAVNAVIDMHGKRVTLAWRNPIPPLIVYALYAIGVLTLGVMGFAGGLRGLRRAVPTMVLVVTLATVVGMIVDLDRPGEGLLQVSQQAMIDLRAGMGR